MSPSWSDVALSSRVEALLCEVETFERTTSAQILVSTIWQSRSLLWFVLRLLSASPDNTCIPELQLPLTSIDQTGRP